MILENNLYGLDIDDRAAQLSGFALMMMARDDDKRIFTRNVRLNVLSLQESNHIDLPTLWKALNLSGSWQSGTSQGLFSDDEQDLSSFNADNRYQLLKRTLARFTQAKTFGSLIDVASDEYEQLKELLSTLVELQESGDSMQKPAAKQLIEIVHQALVLSIRYDAVIANPPYMGNKGMNADLKDYAKENYPNSKSDLFAIFMERAFKLLSQYGFNAQINMQSWMFLSSYEQLRSNLLEDYTFITMAHLGARAFGQISGEVVQTIAWIIQNKHIYQYQPSFYRLIDGNEEDKKKALLDREFGYFATAQEDFKKIPGSPIAYWVSSPILNIYENSQLVKEVAHSLQGMITGDNNKFLRSWYEVSCSRMSIGLPSIEDVDRSKRPWIPYNKGGALRKWYGNNEYLLNWSNSGADLVRSRTQNKKYYFRECVTWTFISSSFFAARYCPVGFVWDVAGSSAFANSKNDNYLLLGLMSSKLGTYILKLSNPTLNFQVENILAMPFYNGIRKNEEEIISRVNELISITEIDWNSFETSWDFQVSPLISVNADMIKDASFNWMNSNRDTVIKTQALEKEVNQIYIDAYGLQQELIADVPLEEITLTVNPKYRYGGDASEQELAERFQSDTIAEFISYALGCMVGRYSLDREGLVYAHSTNDVFEQLVANGSYKTFPADEDGIIPLTDQEWFKDDATNRFREFVQVIWGEEHQQENLDFIAESLCLHAIKPKKSESALETIRRYLSTQFYKDHLKTYKKRPIYWLFSSGKQKAFECLVYLHRYNEGTLSRMRTEYVTPLLGKYDAYAEQLEKQIEKADSTSEANRFKKELDALIKKQVELREFDDKLKHYADMRISLDLDDGVKVNYGKFGDLLADVKAITGSAPEVN